MFVGGEKLGVINHRSFEEEEYKFGGNNQNEGNLNIHIETADL